MQLASSAIPLAGALLAMADVETQRMWRPASLQARMAEVLEGYISNLAQNCVRRISYGSRVDGRGLSCTAIVVLWWAAMHDTCPRTGRIFEIPLSYTIPRVLAVVTLAGVLSYSIPRFFWKKPHTMEPEWLKEAEKFKGIATRVHAPPVYLNPFTNKIPGGVIGPEDDWVRPKK
eukprot:gene11212-18834_t